MEKKISVLLVEDNRLVSKMSVLALEQLSCEVDAVATGKLGIAYADENPYDIIFMDIGLPDINGLDVISHIRKESKLNRLSPIVVLTAHSDRPYIKQSYAIGATDFIVKPFNPTKEAIQRYLMEPNKNPSIYQCNRMF